MIFQPQKNAEIVKRLQGNFDRINMIKMILKRHLPSSAQSY